MSVPEIKSIGETQMELPAAAIGKKTYVSKKTQVLLAAAPFKANQKHKLAKISVKTEHGNEKQQQVGKFVEVMGKGSVDLALWKACKIGDLELVDLLVRERGANVNFRNDEFHGYSPLHIASQKGKFKVAAFLVKNGADVNALGHGKESALHEACYENHPLLALFLLQHGADLKAVTSLNKSALDFSNGKGFGDDIQYLLEAYEEREVEMDQLRRTTANMMIEKTTMSVELGRAREHVEAEKEIVRQWEKQCNDLSHTISERDETINGLHETIMEMKNAMEASVRKAEEEKEELRQLIKEAHSLRRKESRLVGDKEFEIQGLKEQIEVIKAELQETYQDNARLDNFIQHSVKAVARKNQKKIVQRAQNSPRSIKLNTLNHRLKDAEDRAFAAHECKEDIEAKYKDTKKRLVNVEMELYGIRAKERLRKYAAMKIQRWYLKRSPPRKSACVVIQRIARGYLSREHVRKLIHDRRVEEEISQI